MAPLTQYFVAPLRALSAAASSPSAVLSSVVSLSMYGDTPGSALPVSGLEKPLYFDFSIDTSPAAAGAVASCVFFDEEAGQYSSEGCIGMPNPVPQGLRLSWKDGFTVGWSTPAPAEGVVRGAPNANWTTPTPTLPLL